VDNVVPLLTEQRTRDKGVEEAHGHIGFMVAAALSKENQKALSVEFRVEGVSVVRAHCPLAHDAEQGLSSRSVTPNAHVDILLQRA
jgi:hypothetical protein